MQRPLTSSRQTCLRSMLPPLGLARWNLPSSPPSVSASGFGSVSSPSASDLRAADQDFVKVSKLRGVAGLMAEGDRCGDTERVRVIPVCTKNAIFSDNGLCRCRNWSCMSPACELQRKLHSLHDIVCNLAIVPYG